MSYKERLTHLERILRIDKLTKKYNLKGRSSSSYSSANNSSSNASTPSSSDEQPQQQPSTEVSSNKGHVEQPSSPMKEGVEKGIEPVTEENSPAATGGGGGDIPEDENKIELNELKKLVFQGLPGDNQYRALVWRLLLNFLPPNSIDLWDEYLAKKRSNYQHFVNDLLLNQSSGAVSDHPLNPEPDSKWQIFFKDNDVLLQIDKDVRRLCPEISFFQTHTPYPNEHIVSGKMDRLHKRVQSCVLESSNVIRKGLGITKLISKDGSNSSAAGGGGSTNLFPHPPQAPNSTPNLSLSSTNKNSSLLSTSTVSSIDDSNGSQSLLNTSVISNASSLSSSSNCAAVCRKTSLTDMQQDEYHWEVVERILFIYAKLNPGQSYVQGMNEIIGPIYYTLANDPNLLWREYAEADTFYLFTNLMGEIRDFFIRSLDNSVSGIKRMMELLMERLRIRDSSVHQRLVGLEIHPQYYAFRWITLLMSQEFPLPEVLRIWDSLLSDPKRFDFLIDLACAMIIHVRSDLLSGDFPSNMKLLQNYPPIDVRDILRLASTFSASVAPPSIS